jgi:hypothetical protein
MKRMLETTLRGKRRAANTGRSSSRYHNSQTHRHLYHLDGHLRHPPNHFHHRDHSRPRSPTPSPCVHCTYPRRRNISIRKCLAHPDPLRNPLKSASNALQRPSSFASAAFATTRKLLALLFPRPIPFASVDCSATAVGAPNIVGGL